jgi:small nuclear ribonucleoprotein
MRSFKKAQKNPKIGNNMTIEKRPLDALNEARNEIVVAELKNGKVIRGKLNAFDIHLNLTLDEAEELENNEVKRKLGRALVRGDTIILIIPSK